MLEHNYCDFNHKVKCCFQLYVNSYNTEKTLVTEYSRRRYSVNSSGAEDTFETWSLKLKLQQLYISNNTSAVWRRVDELVRRGPPPRPPGAPPPPRCSSCSAGRGARRAVVRGWPWKDRRLPGSRAWICFSGNAACPLPCT